jgi:hypothetical protein
VQARGDKGVGHHLVSSTPSHGTSNCITSINSWPSPILPQLSDQQDKQLKPSTRSKASRDNEKSQEKQKVQQINPKTHINKTASVPSDEEEGLVVSQRIRSSTSQKKLLADPGKK